MDSLSLFDLIGIFVGFIFTIMVFSYVFGDNVLFRVAIHVFIGVAAGYMAVVVAYNVIWPQMLAPLLGLLTGNWQAALPSFLGILLAILLFTKISPRLAELSSPVMAYLVGVGAAAAIGGAVLGTLFPQVRATWNLFDLTAIQQGGGDFVSRLFNGSFVMVGTLATLVYFHFGTRHAPGGIPRRAPWIEIIALVGQGFIAVTFGALLAGVYAASLTALIERLNFIREFFLFLVPL